jgi:type II secretory pathway pseudopilin PulG
MSTPITAQRKQRQTQRQASVLVCMLVCVSIATALVTTTLQSALRARRDLRLQRQLQQTELLLTAGLERATAQLQSDTAYQGETWELDPKTLPNLPPARVIIGVTTADGKAGDGKVGDGEADLSNQPIAYQIHVVARLSDGGPRGTQCSDTLTVNISNAPPQE